MVKALEGKSVALVSKRVAEVLTHDRHQRHIRNVAGALIAHMNLQMNEEKIKFWLGMDYWEAPSNQAALESWVADQMMTCCDEESGDALIRRLRGRLLELLEVA